MLVAEGRGAGGDGGVRCRRAKYWAVSPAAAVDTDAAGSPRLPKTPADRESLCVSAS